MKKFLLIAIVGLMSVSACFAQQAPQNPKDTGSKIVRKIKIQHISPYLLALILSGKVTFNTPSEPNPNHN
jgi:hypothetical protein